MRSHPSILAQGNGPALTPLSMDWWTWRGGRGRGRRHVTPQRCRFIPVRDRTRGQRRAGRRDGGRDERGESCSSAPATRRGRGGSLKVRRRVESESVVAQGGFWLLLEECVTLEGGPFGPPESASEPAPAPTSHWTRLDEREATGSRDNARVVRGIASQSTAIPRPKHTESAATNPNNPTQEPTSASAGRSRPPASASAGARACS